MKIEINKDKLLNSLTIVNKGVTGKSPLPLLEGIYLESKDNYLILKGSDNDLYIQTKISATVIEEGSLVVSAHIFTEIIKKMPNGIINISNDKEMLVIKSKKTVFNVIYMDATEYPQSPKITADSYVSIPQKVIKDMVRGTSFASAIESTRPILQGILFEANEDRLDLVALDGYRLAINTKILENPISENFSLIVDSKCFQEVAKMLDTKGDVKISHSENHICFCFNNTVIYARLLQGTFINYNSLLPSESVIKVKVPKDELADSIERASLVGKSDKTNLVKFEINDDTIVISSNSKLGKVTEEITAEVKGENLKIAFNSKYVLDVLRVIDDKDITLEFNNSVSPCIIKNTEYKYLLLPVRI
ncbi:DNA polymerase III subunit beta [Clostridium sp.]|uniref:DNA polymerase III subunit beta n=1 Tax=Clostridium sp. TaxID=1506 RepID=UPI001B6CF21C|nr:DNA polymerase III subunit beta [Clostridium sp.]MBP3914466.1 DNA polymerase III subunit beta [Clostridium sp.]